jgi:methylated-DNA-[protein]-cysteine S-methyltransferase
MSESFVMASAVGRLRVVIENGRVTQLDYDTRQALTNAPLSAQAKKIKQQIESYLRKPQTHFDIPLDLHGTEFQQRVWRALQKIPLGQTLTYGQLADKLRSSARAVGNACRQNPVPLIVPCHRVVAKNGIGGFSGKTRGAPIARKRWLLSHEGALSA